MAVLTTALIVVCLAAVLIETLLLWGALQMLGRLSWRVDQLELTTPTKVGRSGLKPGTRAPDFALPDQEGQQVSLHDYAGRRLLLVFVQPGCGPCKDVVPELNRMAAARDGASVLVVSRGDLDVNRQWANSMGVRFPVLSHQGLDISRRYEAYATPFGFLIDERGVIRSRGIVNSRQAIGYVLAAASSNRAAEHGHTDPPTEASQVSEQLASQLS
jgi:methylamine dehydrogenase accessory protein MauD